MGAMRPGSEPNVDPDVNRSNRASIAWPCKVVRRETPQSDVEGFSRSGINPTEVV